MMASPGACADRRQQRQLAHGERHFDRVGVVAERAGHAAAARLDRLDLKIGNEPQRRLDRRHRVEGFLMAMAVQLSALSGRHERQIEPSGGSLAPRRNSSNSSARPATWRAASLFISAGISSRKLNRQLGSSPITGTPRATNGASTASVRSASRRASSTLPTERKVRPQHSGRVAVSRRREMNPIAGRGEHGQRGVDVFSFEIAVEGVGEQHDRRRFRVRLPPGICDAEVRHRRKNPSAISAGVRRALKPAMASDIFAAPGMTSRKFISHGSFAA